MQLAWKIAQANRDIVPEVKPHKAYVIYFSLDDNSTELLPRIVSIDQKIPINVVRSPKKHEDNIRMMAKRTDGIKNLKASIDSFKIIDSTRGSSVEMIEDEIRRHKIQLESIDPTVKLVVLIDNFHDITVDSIRFGDNDNGRYDHIANELSRMCTTYDIPLICTAEFRKLNGNRRPTCDDLRSTVKLSYEAKAIILCYNEVGLRGEGAQIYWSRGDDSAKQPVFEAKIGKNKYSSYKGRIFYHFRPEMALLDEISEEDAMRYNQQILT